MVYTNYLLNWPMKWQEWTGVIMYLLTKQTVQYVVNYLLLKNIEDIPGDMLCGLPQGDGVIIEYRGEQNGGD